MSGNPCFSTLYRVEGCAAGVVDVVGADGEIGFSTLYRVEGCAARLRLQKEKGTIYVSVPSIGSKAVQPQPLHHHGRPGPGFSTLYRVEGCAAISPPLSSAWPRVFQYPLSGRRLCSLLWRQLG